jgi:hypothetical protein
VKFVKKVNFKICTNFVLDQKLPNIGAMRIFKIVPEKKNDMNRIFAEIVSYPQN